MITKQQRQIIKEKYGGYCSYCGQKLSKSFHIDHILPKFQRGQDTLDNLNPACASCNINKRNRDIEQFRRFIFDMRESLKKRNTNYIIGLRYGIIQENNEPIIFHFEKWQNSK